MSADPKSEEKEAGDHPKKGKKKLVLVAVALLVVLGGAGGFMALGGSAEPPKESEEEHVEEEERHLLTAKLDTFVVNLAQSGNFLKVTLLLEYDPKVLEADSGHDGGGASGGHGSGGEGAPAEGAMPPVLAKREPMIRDAIIRVLSSKKGEDVMTVQGKETLKEEIVEAVNDAAGLEEAAVVAVYFTEFIVQ